MNGRTTNNQNSALHTMEEILKRDFGLIGGTFRELVEQRDDYFRELSEAKAEIKELNRRLERADIHFKALTGISLNDIEGDGDDT